MREVQQDKTQIVGILKDAECGVRALTWCARTGQQGNVLQAARQVRWASVLDVGRLRETL